MPVIPALERFRWEDHEFQAAWAIGRPINKQQQNY
jgi:hypothetical protein